MDAFFATWHGIDRESIDWGPIVDADKCTGCGLCVVTCGEKRNVFGFNPDRKKSVVLFKDHCMIGCNNCEVGCLWNAISFTHGASYVQEISKKIPGEQIRKELQAKLKGNPDLLMD